MPARAHEVGGDPALAALRVAHQQPRAADLWVPAGQSREVIIDLHHQVAVHSDATIGALDLDAARQVPSWGNRGEVTLHQVLVHVSAETHRHAGHADIIRELIDGSVGVREGMDNMLRSRTERGAVVWLLVGALVCVAPLPVRFVLVAVGASLLARRTE